ncbi:hypothetical protein PBY51_007139 [Eleginops maclovinus]|uniref:Uncharacterized protein n=1 Tax=Eleginops maclovinus TaxID=56733 RepID=A0AAN8AFR4_ELEMC|nr:hypothetical protein PBY51_007139 [Eleginops maclovinus]
MGRPAAAKVTAGRRERLGGPAVTCCGKGSIAGPFCWAVKAANHTRARPTPPLGVAAYHELIGLSRGGRLRRQRGRHPLGGRGKEGQQVVEGVAVVHRRPIVVVVEVTPTGRLAIA